MNTSPRSLVDVLGQKYSGSVSTSVVCLNLLVLTGHLNTQSKFDHVSSEDISLRCKDKQQCTPGSSILRVDLCGETDVTNFELRRFDFLLLIFLIINPLGEVLNFDMNSFVYFNFLGVQKKDFSLFVELPHFSHGVYLYWNFCKVVCG